MNFLFRACLQRALLPNVVVVQGRNYTRWAPRRPLKVIPPEEYEELENKQIKLVREVKNEGRPETSMAMEQIQAEEFEMGNKSPKKTKKHPKPQPKPIVTDMLETVMDADGNFVYTKMMNNDPRVGSLLATIKSKKETAKKDLILLEGKRLIGDALDAKCRLKYLIFTRKEELEYLKSRLPKTGAQLYKMPYKEMEMWSDLTTSPGIMGIFRTPEVHNYVPKISIPLTIVCDNIREPGNLGAILRAAAGVGSKKVILSKGCVNLWDQKVLRSAAGSHFRVQIIHKKSLSDIQAEFKANSRVFIADNSVITGDDANASEIINSLPMVPYYGVKFAKTDELIVIIGGETHGISLDSYKLARACNGARLHIPLDNAIESLNTGTALGIISFEIKRQLNIE